MRVVIVTGTQPHHKSLCATIAQTYNVVGIIHPAETRPSPARLLRRVIRGARSYGWAMVGMHALGKIVSRSKVQRVHLNGERVKSIDFSDGVSAYDRIPRSLIRTQCDVQGADSELLRSLKPDVTLCLGGPVYPKSFIQTSPLTLNFHSGISPIYNGTASIQFAFANGHPHLCGGTLMVMGIEVDGGRILGHYLPEIQSGDTPDSLFFKTVRGAAIMYVRLLEHLKDKGNLLQSIPQPSPLFYTRGFELSWYQRAMIARNLRQNVPARYKRAEMIVEYWNQPTAAAAGNAYRSTLDHLLWNATSPNGQ